MARDPLDRPEEAIRRVYAYVAYRIGDGAVAEDVTSETIERALRYRESYDPRRGSPAAWLMGIASRVIADTMRVRAHEVSAEEPVLERAAPGDVASEVADREELRAALGRLDERSRNLLALRYGADLKAKEIAVLVEMKANAVEVALHRALARLRVELEGQTPAGETRPLPLPTPESLAPVPGVARD